MTPAERAAGMTPSESLGRGEDTTIGGVWIGSLETPELEAVRAALAREIAAAEREATRRALERAAEVVNGEGHEGLAIAIRALAAEGESDHGR